MRDSATRVDSVVGICGFFGPVYLSIGTSSATSCFISLLVRHLILAASPAVSGFFVSGNCLKHCKGMGGAQTIL